MMMRSRSEFRVSIALAATAVLIVIGLGTSRFTRSQEPAPAKPPAAEVATQAAAELEREFDAFVQPLLRQHCVRCHRVDNMKSGIRVDQLSAQPTDRQLFLWKEILSQVNDEAMPPDDEPQPTIAERTRFTDWIQRTMKLAQSRNNERNGSIRRLTVSQYRNTLRELLKLDEDLTDVLPPDGISKDGFANNAQTLILSPLQVEAYFDIAEKSLDLCLVDEKQPPVIQNFRMDLGRKINPAPCPDKLVLGAFSTLLDNADFQVTQLEPKKPFACQPFQMQTKFEFIEGYVGNDTIREWRKFDSIYHAVFACLRGMPGYPKGEAAQTVPAGLLLRPAIPNSEIFGVSNTYGPMANFKISLRELPEHGNFRVTVKAARYDDGLLLDAGTAAVELKDSTVPMDALVVSNLNQAGQSAVNVANAGIYQVDIGYIEAEPNQRLQLQLGERSFSGALMPLKKSDAKDPDREVTRGFLIVRLKAGALPVEVRYGDNQSLRTLKLTRIDEASEAGRRFTSFERRIPYLGVHLGLRRDCGSTLSRVGEPQPVASGELQEFVFSGPINDFPSPDVEKDNVNYLAGIREIGVRSEYVDGREMPRLLIRSIEFEGPFYSEWPPTTHRNIFIDSPHQKDSEAYAREILQSFATRAYRRPVSDEELALLVQIWKSSFAVTREFRTSIKDALLTVLTSPQFLFLIEESSGPQAEELSGYELASKLSYFLWNSPPDARLLELAGTNRLHAALDEEVARLIADPRFGQAMQEFVSQWLSLDKFDVVAIDEKRFPRLTRVARSQLRQEPVQFVQHLIRNNLPVRNLVQSDFIIANDAVATYYNMADRAESGFQFVPISHGSDSLGGVLTQAGILAGLTDGRESNPIKRGAWFARKMIAEPPDDPPPNVPKLPEEDGQKLTLRQKLERHRNQDGCAKCHSGIDPWGLPFEQYDAGGLFQKETAVDARSKLPDGVEVADLRGLKSHLIQDRIDQVSFSFVKHLACYASGRSLTYNELEALKAECVRRRNSDYPMQDLVKYVVKSELFLKK